MAEDIRYEGILQLRNPNKQVLEFVRGFSKRKLEFKIAQEKKVTNGIDLYINKQKLLLALGKKLHEQFVGEYKTSRKLFTRQRHTGKRVYRVNVLLRLPHFKKGQVLVIRDEEYKILAIGNTVKVQDKKTGKKSFILFEEVDRAALLQD